MGLFDFNPNLLGLGAGLLASGQGGKYPINQGAPNQFGMAMQALQGFAQQRQQQQLFDLRKQQMEAEARKRQAEEQRQAAAQKAVSGLFAPASSTASLGQGAHFGTVATPPGALASHPSKDVLQAYGQANPEGLSQLMARQALAAPQSTSLQKNYETAVSQGFKGGLLDYQAAVAQATAAPTKPTERDKLRDSLKRQNFTDAQIDQFFTNKDRYQTQIAADGTTIVTDRYTNTVVPQHFKAPEPTPAGQPREVPPGGFRQGSGPAAAIARGVNTLTDALGAGLAYPESEAAYEAIHQLHNEIVLKGTAEIPGRASNQMRELLASRAPRPGNVFFGEERNLGRMKETRRIMDDEMGRMSDMLADPSGLSAKERADLRLNLSQLNSLKGQLDRIIANYGPRKAPSGAPATITTQEEYNRLPSGSSYIHPDGTTRRKQ